MRRLGLLVALLSLLAAVAGCGGQRQLAGAEIDGLYTLPGTVLVGTDGQPRALAASKPLTLLFFGYANCPDVCTGVITDLAQARNRLSDADKALVDVVVVTTDPARDTPEAWGQYLRRIDPEVVGLTGPLADIEAAGQAVGVEIAQGELLPSGGYEVDHGSQVLAFGRDGRSRLVWTTGKTIGDYKGDIEHLLKDQR